jgi:hypothetical protein
MENTLKHVVWERWLQERNIRGTVAVKVENDLVKLKSLSGPDMAAELLFPVLSAALPDGWLAEAEKLHQSRRNPWLVRTRTGMSGCREYFLYSLRDETFLNQPRVASLHVSMYGKLNEGLRLWMGDLPPLLAAVLQDFPPATEDVSLQVYEPVLRDGYREPGVNSGLQAVIDSLKAMEVISS